MTSLRMTHDDHIPFLQRVACELVASNKGILAADESVGTIDKRFQANAIENNEENRRQYRTALLSNPALATYVSGVILHEETVQQLDNSNSKLVDVLINNKVHPGCKVDKGLVPLTSGLPGEQVTSGLDGLPERCRAAKKAGCTFTKWRAALQVEGGDDDRGLVRPSAQCVDAMANTLARYAAISQAEGLVPIVEPEVLMDGDHSAEAAARANEVVLSALFAAMHVHGVVMEGALLKCSMVTPGKSRGGGGVEHTDLVASLTVRTLMRTVPPAMPGVVFLSGGQTDDDAARNLQAVRKCAVDARSPWKLTFSFGRALHNAALAAWASKYLSGDVAGAIEAAHGALSQRAAACAGS